MDAKDKAMQKLVKPVVGFEESYYITSDGEVFSKDRIIKTSNGRTLHWKGRKIKQFLDKHGYPYVVLSKNGRSQTRFIHRLVALAFIENPNGYNVVNHKDCNPLNNNADNLEWCTQKYNVNYADAQAKHSNTVSNRVACYTKDGTLVREFGSQRAAARSVGVTEQSLSIALKKGEPYTCVGYYWKYIEIKNLQTLSKHGNKTDRNGEPQ